MTHPLHPFLDPQTDSLSWDAAAEQMALIQCLYDANRASAEKILALCRPKAEILSWFIREEQSDDDGLITPSHALIRQGERYYVVIAGTERSVRMWGKNFSGAFNRKGWGGSDSVFVHGYFAFAADEIHGRIDSLIDWEGGRTVSLSGHSLGAAAANLLALRWKSETTQSRIYCIGFGEPRSMSRDYDGPALDGKWRVVNGSDVVTKVPISGNATVTSVIRKVPTIIRPVIDWEHSGTPYFIKSDGTVDGNEPPTDKRVSESPTRDLPLKAHFPDSYLLSLAAIHKTHGTSQESGAAIAQAIRGRNFEFEFDSLDLPQADRLIDLQALNEAIVGAAEAVFDASNVGDIVFSRVEPTTAVAGPASDEPNRSSGNSEVFPMAGDVTSVSLWRVTAHVNSLLYGDSHSVVISGPQNREQAIAAAKTWVNKRAAMLGSTRTTESVAAGNIDPDHGGPRYEWMTVQDALNPRDSTPVMIKFDDGAGYNSQAGGNSTADVLSTAISVRMLGISAGTSPKRAYHTETFVGNPDKVVERGQIVRTVKVLPSLTWGNAMKAYLDFLVGNTYQFGFLGQDQADTRKLVTAFANDADGQLKCTVVGHGYDSGDWLKLTGKVGKKLRKTYRIRKESADMFTLLGSEVSADTLPREGYAQRVRTASGVRKQVFYRFNAVTAQAEDSSPLLKLTKRNLHPRSIPVSFAQKGRKK